MKIKNSCRKYIIPVFFCCLAAVLPSLAQKPSVAVIDFETRPQVGQAAGRELSDILVNALLDTQKFTVVDRSRTSQVLQEQKAALSGMVDPATGATVGKMLGAQYLIVGSVTEFAERKEDLMGGWLKLSGVNTYHAIVKFNLKVINSTTAEITFSKSFEKEEKTTGLSGSSASYDLPDFKSKAMQDAIRKSMQDAVSLLTERLGSLSASAGPQRTEYPVRPPDVSSCSQIAGGKLPRVMVVIPETHISQKVPDPAGETEIIKKLVGLRFNVVDQQQVAAIRDREKVLTALKNPQAAASLGAEFGADIIIIGEAFSETAGRDQGMISTRARVEAKAIQTDTARILAADGTFGSGLDIAEFVSAKAALRNAGGLWADSFLGQYCQSAGAGSTIIGSGGPAAPMASSVEIMIANISYGQLKQFGAGLEGIAGVSSVEKKFTGNVANIDVQFAGSAEKLADAISAKRFGVMKVNIVGLTGNKIEISVR